MNLHIITGASRGLGAGLAQFFSAQGDHIADISRNSKAYPFDLSTSDSKEMLLKKIFLDFDIGQYKTISLTNNAGMVEPIKSIENLTESEIFRNITVNLIAPMSLTSAFLKLTATFSGRRVITNVSTGVVKNPKSAWAAYSAAKTGLEVFSKCLIQEYSANSKVHIFNFEPGIIDTEMQALIRQMPESEFSEVARFKSLKENGQLLDPHVVGEALGKLILSDSKNNFVSVYDVIQ